MLIIPRWRGGHDLHRCNCTYRIEIRASCNFNQNHGITEDRRGEIVKVIFVQLTAHPWQFAASSPVDICCWGHAGAASQKDLWGTIQAIHIPTVKTIVGGLNVLLSVGCETVI